MGEVNLKYRFIIQCKQGITTIFGMILSITL